MNNEYISVDLTITHKCNMHCKYCGMNCNKDTLIPLEEMKSRVDKIFDLFDNKIINFIILGGEITIIDPNYLDQLLYYIIIKNNSRIGNVYLYTNGKLYSEILHKYQKYDGVYVVVSVDTIDEKYDLRGIDMDNLKNTLISYYLPKIIIASTLSNINLFKYKELQEYFIKLGINKFKFKYERSEGIDIETTNENIVNEARTLLEQQLVKSKYHYYVDNCNLNTVAILILDEIAYISIHTDIEHNRTKRHVLGKVNLDGLNIINMFKDSRYKK